MFYVVLELETSHQVETPKDHSRITKCSYQFINSETLQATFEEPKSIDIPDMANAFKDTISQLEADIKAEIVDFSDFVLCSLFSVWDIRVTLPRQAHDLGFILPSYLKHPRVFNLWKEFDKWCGNHPEVIPMRKSNLRVKSPKTAGDISDIVNILEIDTSLQVPLSTSNPQTLLSIQDSTNILTKLRKKCTTLDDVQLVLTRPYDSYADIKTFLQERSRVLYMNNLPSDTTQSELESWFTQFGARPIGFWTAKNTIEETSSINSNWSLNGNPLVDEQDCVAGFVVFQSHEEATEALVLNGRSILSNIANTKQPRVCLLYTSRCV